MNDLDGGGGITLRGLAIIFMVLVMLASGVVYLVYRNTSDECVKHNGHVEWQGMGSGFVCKDTIF